MKMGRERGDASRPLGRRNESRKQLSLRRSAAAVPPPFCRSLSEHTPSSKKKGADIAANSISPSRRHLSARPQSASKFAGAKWKVKRGED